MKIIIFILIFAIGIVGPPIVLCLAARYLSNRKLLAVAGITILITILIQLEIYKWGILTIAKINSVLL